MPTVPYDHPLVQEQGLPGVRVSTDSSLESFGGGQSAANLTQADENLGGAVHDIASQEKQKADQVAFMAADRQLSVLQTQLQVQTSQMKGKDAAQAPDKIGDAWSKGVSALTDGLSNEAQKMAVAKAANDRFEALNRHVQTHVAGELQSYDDNETAGYIATSRQNIALNYDDDDTINSELEKQKATLDRWAERKGVAGSEQFQSKVTEELSASHKAVIEARLNAGDNDGAKEYYDDQKKTMTADDIHRADNMIENADVTAKGLDIYSKVKGMTLSDNMTPDEEKMRAAVFAQTSDMSTKRQLKIWENVKAQANEAFVNQNKQNAAIDRSFMNAALDAKKQGASVTDAMKLAEQFSQDDYDKATKEDAVRKMYAAPTESDPGTYIALWERIQKGGASKQEIDDAFANNLINAKDWRSTREEYFKMNVEGKAPEMQNAMERIKTLAESRFGSNKENMNNFLYEMHQERLEGKTPEDLWKTANDKLKSDPNTGFLGFFKDAQWKTDLKKSDAANLAWGTVHQDVGKDVVNAIGKGILLSGKPNFGLSDIDSFAAQLGGYDKIKSGTPANNAIQALMARKKAITPDTVQTVLSIYPDGKVPAPMGVASR